MSIEFFFDNPLSTDVPSHDIGVDYDDVREQFVITFSTDGCGGYTVQRSELVGDFKYRGELIDRMLDMVPEEEDIYVLFTNQALNQIELIREANCFLF